MNNTYILNNCVTNWEVKGIEDAEFYGFLNEYLGSDCHSFILVQKNGKFFAYELKRNFTPKFNGDYCYNNEEQCAYPLEIVGDGVEVKPRRGGTWGHWVVETWLGEPLRTPSGRLKKSWVDYGVLYEYSCQFTDYNN